MLNPSMSELLKKVDNRYLLVNLTAKRAREIAEQAEVNEVKLAEKPVTMALNDIVSGRIVNCPEKKAAAEPEVLFDNGEPFEEEEAAGAEVVEEVQLQPEEV